MIVSQASALAMADLFISATAALLMVLAVSQPFEPLPLPIQADLLASCPENKDGAGKSAVIRPWGETAGEPREVRIAADLANAPAALGLPPKSYYLLAVVPGADGVIAGRCFSFVANDLVGRSNTGLDKLARNHDAPRSVFVISLPNVERDRGE